LNATSPLSADEDVKVAVHAGPGLRWPLRVVPCSLAIEGRLNVPNDRRVVLLCDGFHVSLWSSSLSLHRFVSQMSFFARVSDPLIGGTYMTLLNTVANLGSKWPTSLSLVLMEPLTSATCLRAASGGGDKANKQMQPFEFSAEVGAAPSTSCATRDAATACAAAGGTCDVAIDGYFIQQAICLALGALWLIVMRCGRRTSGHRRRRRRRRRRRA
jgi:hypothetical protein